MPAQIDLAAYDTDKSPAYLANYEREFGHLFNEPMALLELGVQRGGSMLLWRDLMPEAEIVGLDLNEIEIPDDPRLHIYQGFQQDPVVLDELAAAHAPEGFDVIIDDASHVGKYTAESFWHLFPKHLKSGGVYVLDDWGSGYWSDWADGRKFRGSRATLGDTGAPPAEAAAPASADDVTPGRIEQLRREVRAKARPMAAKLSPEARARMEKLYMKAEGLSMQTRFKSHDYGMVGFVKQLVDAAAIVDIDRDRPHPFKNDIRAVHVTASQVFVHKA